MLDDLAVVVDAEDVDASPVGVAGPLLITVQHDELPFRDRALELDALAGIVARGIFEIIDETLLAVGDSGLCWMYSAPA